MRHEVLNRPFSLCRITTVFVMALTLVACVGGSGGGGDGDPPGTPVLALQIHGNDTLRFTWLDVAGETAYVLLEDSDGASGYSDIATVPADTTSFDLVAALPSRLDARYVLEARNENGASRSNEVRVIDAVASEGTYVKASNTQLFDTFGSAVALSGDGNTLAIAATGEDSGATGVYHPGDTNDAAAQADNSVQSSGAVYVYTRAGSSWTRQAYLKAWNNDAGDHFGCALGLSDDGDTLAVGAFWEDGNGVGGQVDNSMSASGAVYVFVRLGDTWSLEAYVKAQNPGVGDSFGGAVALSGDGSTLAVGANLEDGNGTDPDDDSVPNSGAVYVFVRSASTWYQEAYLKAPVVGEEDFFGNAVALSDDGDVLAVGVKFDDAAGNDPRDDSAEDSGAVYVFGRDGSDWTSISFLKGSNTEAGDVFGRSVALSGDGTTLAVGAVREDGDGSNEDDNSMTDSGAVYVFHGAGIIWTQTSYCKALYPGALDLFGDGLALSNDGTVLLIGAEGEDSAAVGIDGDGTDDSAEGSGAAYVFVSGGGPFAPYLYVKSTNTDLGDVFGAAVALADDGVTLAIGARREQSAATGIDGDQTDDSVDAAGAGYIYEIY